MSKKWYAKKSAWRLPFLRNWCRMDSKEQSDFLPHSRTECYAILLPLLHLLSPSRHDICVAVNTCTRLRRLTVVPLEGKPDTHVKSRGKSLNISLTSSLPALTAEGLRLLDMRAGCRGWVKLPAGAVLCRVAFPLERCREREHCSRQRLSLFT